MHGVPRALRRACTLGLLLFLAPVLRTGCP